MKTIWCILVIAIVIVVKGDGDLHPSANTDDPSPSPTTAGTLPTTAEPKVVGKDMNANSEGIPSSSTTEKMENPKASGVSQVTDTVQPSSTSTSSSTGPPATGKPELVLTGSSPEMPPVEGKGYFTRLGTTTTKSTSSTSAPTPNTGVDSLPTSTTSSPPTQRQSSSSSTTSEATTTESSSAKNPKCCCCTDCEGVAVKPISTTPRTNGGVVATGRNLSVKGINKSPVMAIIITVSFLTVVTFMSFCYRRRGDISMKVRTWSIRARQFDFHSLRPVCLRWKKPNSESSPILVFKVDESELDVLTENMV